MATEIIKYPPTLCFENEADIELNSTYTPQGPTILSIEILDVNQFNFIQLKFKTDTGFFLTFNFTTEQEYEGYPTYYVFTNGTFTTVISNCLLLLKYYTVEIISQTEIIITARKAHENYNFTYWYLNEGSADITMDEFQSNIIDTLAFFELDIYAKINGYFTPIHTDNITIDENGNAKTNIGELFANYMSTTCNLLSSSTLYMATNNLLIEAKTAVKTKISYSLADIEYIELDDFKILPVKNTFTLQTVKDNGLFLSHQPECKILYKNAPETIFFIAKNYTDNLFLIVKTIKDEQPYINVLNDILFFTENGIYEINAAYNFLSQKIQDINEAQFIEIWIAEYKELKNEYLKVSQTQVYKIDRQEYDNISFFKAQNSFGTFDTFTAYGQEKQELILNRVLFQNTNTTGQTKAERQLQITKNSGWITDKELKWWQELLSSNNIFIVINNITIPIQIATDNILYKQTQSFLFNVEFQYNYSPTLLHEAFLSKNIATAPHSNILTKSIPTGDFNYLYGTASPNSLLLFCESTDLINWTIIDEPYSAESFNAKYYKTAKKFNVYIKFISINECQKIEHSNYLLLENKIEAIFKNANCISLTTASTIAFYDPDIIIDDIVGGSGTASLSVYNNTIICYSAGYYYDLQIRDSLGNTYRFPLAEGNGYTIHDVNHVQRAIVNNHSWTTQNSFFYNLTYGCSILNLNNGKTIYVPYNTNKTKIYDL